MPMLVTDGAEIFFEEIGDGPYVLMLAGIASDSASWGPLTPLLENRFHLVLPDNRGCGQTRYQGGFVFDDFVRDCVALLDHLGIEQIDVVGHSLGGIIGLHLAARYPNRVRRLVTLGSGLSAKSRLLMQDLAEIYQTASPRLYFRLIYQFLFSAPFFENAETVDAVTFSSLSYVHRQSPSDFCHQVAAFDSIRRLDTSTIKAKVLAVAAGSDFLASSLDVTRLHAGIPHLRDALIPDIGHSIHWETPTRAAELVIDFLSAR